MSLAKDLDPLVAAFNRAKARPRFLAILSPTCPACVHGAVPCDRHEICRMKAGAF